MLLSECTHRRENTAFYVTTASNVILHGFDVKCKSFNIKREKLSPIKKAAGPFSCFKNA